MMNNNYNNYGYLGGVNPMGYSYNPNQNPPKLTQTLTKEQIAMLRNNVDKFSLGLTQEDVYRGICFHRDSSGQETLRPNPDGTVTCTICGYTFNPTQDLTEDETQECVSNLVDILQTIKLLYLDMPVDAAQEFFQIIPLIEKIPKLFKIASDNFAKHENWNNWKFNGAPNTINLYNMLQGGAFGGVNMYNPQGGYGQPSPQQQMSMGGMGQMPMGGVPMTGTIPMPGSNGMGFMGAPTPGYQPAPTAQGYQYNAPVGVQPTQMQQPNPVAPSPIAPPTSAVNNGNVVPSSVNASTDGKDVKVDAKFKA